METELSRMIRAFNVLLADFSEQAIDLEIERERTRQLELDLRAANEQARDLAAALGQAKDPAGKYDEF